jgi:NAD-dependent dihydropyrimidine dehydrogenase PreA subunit
MPPRIDPDLCEGCGRCLFECGVYVLALDAEDRAHIVRKGCVDCFLCEMVCPTGAIRMVIGRELGGVSGKASGRRY